MESVKGLANPVMHAAAPVPAADKPAEAGHWAHIKDTVAESQETWAQRGRKIGTLAAAVVVTATVPILIASALPAVAGVVLGIPGLWATLWLTGLEEKHIGLAKKAAGVVGLAVGTGVGLVKGAAREALGLEPSNTHVPYELPTRKPTGDAAREPLLPSLVHKAEKAVLGHVPERNRATEVGEGLGILAATGAGAITLPMLTAGLATGPIGILATSLLAPLVAMTVVGAEENAIGLGRTIGELGGAAVGALLPTHDPDKAAPPADPSKPSVLARASHAMLHGMTAIAEPIVTFLVDGATLTGNLFREKAWQTMEFAKRPNPQVDSSRLQSNFLKLAGISGVYRHEQLIGGELTSQLTSMGFDVKRQPDGTVIGTLPGTVPDAPTILLSAHQDTVMPTSPDSIRVDKTRIRTDGTHCLGGDDRAGCAQIIEGIRTVLEQKADRPEIKVVFPIGEEAGLKGSADLRPEDISNRPTLGFVCDSLAVDSVFLSNDSVIVTPNSLKYNYSQEDPIVQVVLRSMANAGTKAKVMHCGVMAGAGTDGNTPAFNTKNIRSIAVGAGERDIHTPLENIKIDDLIQGARHVVGYITNACDLKVDGDKIVPRQAVEG